MTSINLIPASRRQARQRRARTRRWAGVVFGYAAVLAAAWAAAVIWLAPAEERLDQQMTALDERIKDDGEQATATQRFVAEARANLEANQVIAGRPDWSLLLALLAAHVGDEVVLNECGVEPGGAGQTVPGPGGPGLGGPGLGGAEAEGAHFVLRLAGVGRSQAAVSQFVLRLEQLGLFDRVTLLDTRREPFGADSAVGFRAVCIMHVREGAGK